MIGGTAQQQGNSVLGAVSQGQGNAVTGAASQGQRFGIPVQRIAASPGDGSSTTLTVAFTNTPNTGNLIIVLWKISTTTITLSSFADTNGNNFILTPQSPFIDAPNTSKVWVLYLIVPPSMSKTLTFTTNTAIGANASNLMAVEVPVFGGSPAVDTSAYGSGSSTTVNLPSITPAGAGEFMYSMGLLAQTWISTNLPWTVGGAATPDGDNDGYIVSSTAAATAVNQTQSPTGTWVAVSAAFK